MQAYTGGRGQAHTRKLRKQQCSAAPNSNGRTKHSNHLQDLLGATGGAPLQRSNNCTVFIVRSLTLLCVPRSLLKRRHQARACTLPARNGGRRGLGLRGEVGHTPPARPRPGGSAGIAKAQRRMAHESESPHRESRQNEKTRGHTTTHRPRRCVQPGVRSSRSLAGGGRRDQHPSWTAGKSNCGLTRACPEQPPQAIGPPPPFPLLRRYILCNPVRPFSLPLSLLPSPQAIT